MSKKLFITVLLLSVLCFLLTEKMYASNARSAQSGSMSASQILAWGTSPGVGRGWHLNWNQGVRSEWQKVLDTETGQDIAYHGLELLNKQTHGKQMAAWMCYWYGTSEWKSPKKWVIKRPYKTKTTYAPFVSANGPKATPDGKKSIAFDEEVTGYDQNGKEVTANYEEGILTRREKPPLVILETKRGLQTTQSLGEFRSGAEVDFLDPDIPYDSFTDFKWTEPIGVTVKQRWYGYVNEDYDDFLIVEMIVINSGNTNGAEDPAKKGEDYQNPDQVLKDFWFGIGQEFDPFQDYYAPGNENRSDQVVDFWGDGVDMTHYQGMSGIEDGQYNDPEYMDIKMIYYWDGDEIGVAGNDQFMPRGGPSFNIGVLPTGEFTAPGMIGLGILHADTSPDDQTHDTSQPCVSRWKRFMDWVDPFDGGPDVLNDAYDFLTGKDQSGDLVTGYHQEPLTSPQVPTEHRLSGMLGFGPYNLEFGDSIRVVFALVCGAIDEERAVRLGMMAKNNPEKADSCRKVVFLEGRKAMFDNFLKAKEAFNSNYIVPRPPEVPDLVTSLEPGTIVLDWSRNTNRDPAHINLPPTEQYLLYKNVGGVGPGNQAYDLIATLSGDVTQYVDEDVIRGFNYWYYVIGVSVDGLRSWRGGNKTGDPIMPFQRGLRSTADSVVVVPNPFNVSGGDYTVDQPHNMTGFNKGGDWRANNTLYFLNLPEYCIIRIFNSAGDLIKIFEHNSGTADEEWSPMITDQNQVPASGVYFYTVEVTEGVLKGEVGTGKFIVIR